MYKLETPSHINYMPYETTITIVPFKLAHEFVWKMSNSSSVAEY